MLYFVQNFRNCGDFIPFSRQFPFMGGILLFTAGGLLCPHKREPWKIVSLVCGFLRRTVSCLGSKFCNRLKIN